MKYKLFIVFNLTLLFAVGCLGQPTTVKTNSDNSMKNSASFPNTNGGKRAEAFWKLLNSKDDATLNNFIKDQMTENKEIPVQERVDNLQQMRRFLGGSTLLKMAGVSETRISFFIKTPRSTFAQLEINFDPKADSRINGIGLDRVSENDVNNFSAENSKALTEAEFIPTVKDYLNTLSQKDDFSGAVLIAKNGKAIFTEAYGLADRESKIPNKTDTKFNLGSINKMFTTVAIGMLADEGKLTFDDKIEKFLPDYPNKEATKKVTIYQLLTMTSGIGDIFGKEYDAMPKSKLRTINAYLPLFASKPLEFKPGTSRRYSNGGYLVLGAIIEKASGQSYYDFVETRIFKPLGMKNTESFESDADIKNLAKGYTLEGVENNKRKNNIDTLPAKGSSGGGGYSTLEDMLKFGNAVGTDKFPVPGSLKNSKGIMIAEMLTGGLGVGGGAPGINAVIETKLPGNYTVIVLSNYDPPTASKTSKQIRNWIRNIK